MQEKIENYKSEGNWLTLSREFTDMQNCNTENCYLKCTKPPFDFILSKDDKFLLNVWGNVICIETLNTFINIIIK